MTAGFPSYPLLRACSFTHSAIYLTLLTLVAIPGHQGAQTVFGWGHGIGWIAMVCLSLLALRRRTISLTMAALIAIGGAVGPFMGSAAFVVLDRRAGSLPRRRRRGALNGLALKGVGTGARGGPPGLSSGLRNLLHVVRVPRRLAPGYREEIGAVKRICRKLK